MRIVSHNVFWFQGAPFATDQPGEPDDEVVARLIQLYKQLDADVYCIQEIQDERTARRLGDSLGLCWVYMPGAGYPQYGGAVFSRWPLEVAKLSSGTPVDRVQQRVRLRPVEDAPIDLSHVHLPSGRQRGAEGGQAQRLKEIALATVPIDDQSHGPHFMVGDFNERPGGLCADFLGTQGYVDAAALFGAGDTSSTLSGARVDQVWVHQSLAPHLLAYFFIDLLALRVSTPDKQALSDHFPVGIDWVLPPTSIP